MKNIKSIAITLMLSTLLGVTVAVSLFSPRPVFAYDYVCADGPVPIVVVVDSPDQGPAACQDAIDENENENSSDTVNPLGDYRVPTGDREISSGSICGHGGEDNKNEVKVAFDFGCRGLDYPGDINPIIDILFALFRFLSVGVGMVVIGSVIVGGIQYSASRGNPQATQAAIKRIVSSVGALFLYIFIFAIANFLIPGGMF